MLARLLPSRSAAKEKHKQFILDAFKGHFFKMETVAEICVILSEASTKDWEVSAMGLFDLFASVDTSLYVCVFSFLIGSNGCP